MAGGSPRDKGTKGSVARAAVLVSLVLLAFVFGYIGIWQYVHSPGRQGLGRSWWDVLYYDVQLFPLGSQVTDNGPPYNIWLELGRFLAAAATVNAIIFASAGWFRRRLRLIADRQSRGHVVVVGDSLVAAEIVGRFRRAGAGPKVLTVAESTAAGLRAAGVAGARRIYICADDSADSSTNVAVTRLVLGIARDPTDIFTMVSDARLALILRARRLVARDDERHPVHIFSPDELAARQHVRGADLGDCPNPHLLIVGASTFGRALIVEFAKKWRVGGRTHSRATVTLVDDKARAAVDEIAERWPFVAEVCDIDPVEQPLEAALLDLTVPPVRSFFCHDDEDLALRSALSAAVRWPPRPASIVVRLNRLTRHAQAFTSDLFDDLGGAVDVVSVATSVAEEVLVPEDAVEVFARRIHAAYVKDRRDLGETPETNPSTVPWDELPSDLRQANLAQARDFRAKLNLIGCTVAPRSRLADPFVFNVGDVERLARAEHTRWVAERSAAGWTHGPVRDNKRKKHPLLVDWDRLDESQRDQNRTIVREFPLKYDSVLVLEGLQIVRLAAHRPPGPAAESLAATLPEPVLERIARAVHDRYLADERAKGTVMGTGSRVAWEELEPTYQRSNLDQARDIGAKLDLIGAFPVPAPPPVAFRMADEEVELLAVQEHERWRRERIDDGWRYGAVRDSGAKRHPALVPWFILSEHERERDREAVRAIPELLQRAGYCLTRQRPAS